MKYVVTADIHLKNWSDKEFDEDGNPIKLIEILNAFKSICDYAKKNKIKHVIVAGDVNDTKEVASVNAFVQFKKILEDYADLNFYILHGNHDAVTKENNKSAIQLLDGPENVITILETRTDLLKDIIFVPYSENMVEDISEAEPCKVMIGHLGLSEGQLSSGISLQTPIQLNHLKKFGVVLLGHYHKPQHLKNTYYCGSLIPLRRDEMHDEKRFLVLDTETLDIKSIPITCYRKYVEFIITNESDNKELLQQIQKAKENGDHIIIKKDVKVMPPDFFDLTDIHVIDTYEEEYQIRGIRSSMEFADQLTKYMEIEEIPESDMERYLHTVVKALDAED